jgi:predicted phosphodiesterase
MTIGFFADSHGDFEALARGYDTLVQHDPEKIYFLGDLIHSYQYSSENQSITFLRKMERLGDLSLLRGEKEIKCIEYRWNYLNVFSIDNLHKIIMIPTDIYLFELDALLVHSLSPDLERELDDKTILEAFEYHRKPRLPQKPETGLPNLKRIIFGHTHIPLIYSIDPKSNQIEKIIPKANIPINLEKEHNYAINISALTNKYPPKARIINNIDPDIIQSVCLYDSEKDSITYVPLI